MAISANTAYVASNHTAVGNYAEDATYFAVALSNPPLLAPCSGSSGGNAVYLYGNGGFPNQTYDAANYWVDVVFTTR